MKGLTQADSVHSTPPTNTPTSTTRRDFLQGAGAAAGGAVLALATIQPAQVAAASASAADPALRVIAAHAKIAEAVLLAEAEMQERRTVVSENEFDEFDVLSSAEMGPLS
jgi:hypothetical protein